MLYFLIESPTIRSLAKSPARKSWAHLGMAVAVLLSGVIIFVRVPMGFVGFSIVGVIVALSLALHENRLLVNRLTLYAGKVSYSGYLCHTVALHLVNRFGIWNTPRLPLPPLVQFVLFSSLGVTITLLVSTLTYRLIEVPGRNLGRALLQRLKNPPVAQPSGAYARSEQQP
jgi:peptidoglycan/LPS O-acetylase OafA/YrhL